MKTALLIQDLFIYPIKSLGGIRLESANVEERGFQHDRRWMLVDKNGIFLTQRTHRRLALIQVEIIKTGLLVFPRHDPSNQIDIPFDLVSSQELTVTIWDDEVKAKLISPEIDAWFSDRIDMDCHLVKMPLSSHRKVSLKYAVNDESVSFADGMPYLIIGQESLNHLNSKLENEVKMNRFRPNIVFSGGESYQEDNWIDIKIGAVDFCVVKPCVRCVLITVDQETGESGKEPLKTLASYRTINNGVHFGQNVVALTFGVIKTGDQLVIGSI